MRARLAACLLLSTALLGTACTGTSEPEAASTEPEAAGTEPAPATVEPAPATTETPVATTSTTAYAAPPTTEAPTATPTAQPIAVGQVTAMMAGMEQGFAEMSATLTGAVAAFDRDGIEGVAALSWSQHDVTSLPFLMVVDDEGNIVVHPDSSLIGQNIIGDLGRDMYGYPWHERFMSLPAEGVAVVTMNQAGSRNAYTGAGDFPAVTSPFDDWRADRLLFRLLSVRPHGGYRFALVSTEVPTALVSNGMVYASAQLIAAGTDVADAAAQTITNFAFAALAHAGLWHVDNSEGGEQFVGFVADSDGVIIGSEFNTSIVGQTASDLIGPGALSHATPEGVRYRDEARGVDVTLLSTPQGLVVGGGVAGR